MQDKLLTLIQALSPEEKAYFVRYSKLGTTQTKPDYLRLFEVVNEYVKQEGKADSLLIKEEINKSEEETLSDEPAKKVEFLDFLHTKLALHPKILKHISNKKKELRNKILESLVLFHAKSNLEADLMQVLAMLPILATKKQWKELATKINYAKKKALKGEKYWILSRLVDWEMKLLLNQKDKKLLTKYDALVDRQEQYQDIWSRENHYRNLYTQLILLVQEDLKLVKPSNLKRFEALYQNPLLRDDAPLDSIIIRSYYHRIHNNYYRNHPKKRDLGKSYRHAKTLVNCFEENPLLLQSHTNLYINALCSLSRNCHEHQKYDDLEAILAKIQAYLKVENMVEALEATCDMGLVYYINTHNYDKAQELCSLMEQNWAAFTAILQDGKVLYYCYMASLLYWVINDLEKAYDWINRMYTYPNPLRGKNFLYAGRLIELIIVYELAWPFLSDRLDSARKTLHNNHYRSPFEKIVIQHLRRLIQLREEEQTSKHQSIDKEQSLLQSLLDQLEVLVEQINIEGLRPPTGLAELQLWCRAKLSGKTMKDLLME